EGSGDLAVSRLVKGLQPNITYVYRLAGANAEGEAFGAGETFSTLWRAIATTREYPPDDLYCFVEPPKGQRSRWAADESLTENVITDIRLTDEMPGGDKEGSWVFARDPRASWPDLAPFSDITVKGRGGEEVAHYRLDKTPESDGDHMAITGEAVGWSKALEDDNAMIGPGFIDSDLSKWEDPTTERRKRLREAAIYLLAATSLGRSEPATESEAAGIVNDFTGVTAEEGKEEAGESDYDSGGVDIGQVLYDRRTIAVPDAAFISDMALGKEATFTVEPKVGPDLEGATALSQSLAAPGSGYRYARLRDRFQSTYVGAMTNLFAWQNLKVLGSQGLTLQGTWPNVGFTVSQMLAWAIPQFTCLEARPEDLEDLGYIIEQAWFSDPGPMSQVVQELTKYELLDWFVFGGRRFKLKQPGTYGRRWQAYAGPSSLQEQGFDASRSWKEILVVGQDVTGRQLSVGAIGSGATVETPALEITDPGHPAVQAAEAYGPNFVRRDRLDLRGISTPARMIEVGEIWLREASRLNRSGSASFSGYLMDDKGVMRPVSHVRAGDEVRFPDASDTSFRKIVRRSYEHDARTCTVDLDAPPEGLQALLERLQADVQALSL
ncbi:MAG TPA: hypothetical protein VLC07_04045, partial [Solirubrobacterales bacterium]|nr:hypothetical protein [Solirubrobacterales bacterium]